MEPSKTKRTSYEKKRSSGIRVTVIKTGDRTKHCVITATSMEQLMSQATEKLKSTTAIRGVFKNWIHFLFGDNFEIVDNFDDNIFGSSLKKTVQS